MVLLPSRLLIFRIKLLREAFPSLIAFVTGEEEPKGLLYLKKSQRVNLQKKCAPLLRYDFFTLPILSPFLRGEFYLIPLSYSEQRVNKRSRFADLITGCLLPGKNYHWKNY